jgi:hypothetical protein
MSSLWTPSGEHRVDPDAPRGGPPPPPPPPAPPPGRDDEEAVDPEAQVAALRERLITTPAETVVANHCYGLFELAAIYLSADPPRLDEARLAIDAFGMLVDGLGDRLGETAGQLREALAQLRLGYVQVENAQHAAEPPAASPDGAAD